MQPRVAETTRSRQQKLWAEGIDADPAVYPLYNEPIGPHPTHREKMALRTDHPDARPAETFFQVVERFPGFAPLRTSVYVGGT